MGDEAREEVPSVATRGGGRWVRIGLALGALGIGAWALRWILQGGAVVWTDVARRFWLPDAALGWVESEGRWVWLGLDGLVVALALLAATLGLTLGARRLARGSERRRSARLLRSLAALGAGSLMLVPVLPMWALVSGLPPESAERLLPSNPSAAAPPQQTAGPFPVPGGRWVLVETPASHLVARIAAGGETFEGRFGPLSAELVLDAAVLERTRATLRVPAASLDTGIELRNTHARGYLESETHASITLALPQIDFIRCQGASCAFSTSAELTLIGRAIPVTLTGTSVVIDEGTRRALGVTARHALLVTASFELPLALTPLDRSDFDADTIPLSGRIVLVPANAAPENAL
jgi:polyisoprenoid-binding protein YceI